ncbi:MAG: hypothetical protein RMJ36_03670, partial [Candidatus Calescibacterium sp.]|nr:hypothetical protein [Candidatus Calescibacterium sp.]MDW8132736.1 hypothetical protein [Candidatus Calescibacterium sp.]
MSKKKGILLLTTLFFIVVLIMMSVALFGLTQSNYKTLKDYDARQKAMLNAENAIQIVSFLISHNPSAFIIDTSSNPAVINFPSLDNSNKFGKIINNFQQISSIYNFLIINLSNGQIMNIGASPNVNISRVVGNSGAVFVFWDSRATDIAQNGAIIFFGNYINDGVNDFPGNLYYGSSNSQANSLIVRFNNNQLVIDSSGNGFPLYSSYNRSFNDGDVWVNGRRIVKSTSLALMAMGYARVPSTNRYVVTYVDQHFSNSGFNQAGSLVSEGSTIIDAEKLEAGTYSNQQQNNKFYSNRFMINLKEGNEKYTKFYTVSQDSNGQYQAQYGGVKGEVIAQNAAETNWNYSFKYDNKNFKSIQEVRDDQDYTNIRDFVGAEFNTKTIDSKFDKVRNSLLNEVKSKFNNPSSYRTLNPGYYVFVNDKTIIYFPQTAKYSQIDETLSKAVKSDGTIVDTELTKVGATRYSSSIVANEVYMQNYNLVVKKNVKLDSAGGFIHITSWKASYDNQGRVDSRGDKIYRFGKVDIGVSLL